MCVVDPVKVTLLNYPQDKTEEIKCPDFPPDFKRGHHHVQFSRTLYIDRDDFRLKKDKVIYQPPAFIRTISHLLLNPRYAYWISYL